MADYRPGSWLAIVLTLIAALALTILPLPEWAVWYRPEWLALAVIYWSMALPRHTGVGTAWVAGLFLDVSRGAILGQHALALALVAWLSIAFHQRMRVYPLWQQTLGVGTMLVPYLLLILWIKGITGNAAGTWLYWMPLAASMAVWPLVFHILRDLRRRFCTELG